MASPSLSDLRIEHASAVVGPLIDLRVRDLVRRVAYRYPPVVYARSAQWDEDAYADLAQDVFARLLDGHLTAIFDFARTLAGFDTSVRELTRDVLGQRRQRTVIDNLIDRIRERAADDPFSTTGSGADLRIGLGGATAAETVLSDAQVREAAQRVVVVPRLSSNATERAPRVYSPEHLVALLIGVLRTIDGSIGLTDLRRILSMALTDLAVSEHQYVADDSSQDTPADIGAAEAAPGMAERPPGPELVVLARDTAGTMMREFTSEQRILVRMKFAGASDGDIATALSISRPTAAKRKVEALAVLEAGLRDLEDRQVAAVVAELMTLLAQDPEVPTS